jgi:Transposase DDE domain
LTTITSSRGKANYTNLSRFSHLNEKTFRRWFTKKLDFVAFNRVGNSLVLPELAVKIAAWDCSFIKKSGHKTYGLGKFWDSKQGKAEKGLEISTLAVVDVDYNTAYHVSTRQTPAESAEGETRVHEYVRQFNEDCKALPEDVRYIVTDAFYTKILITLAILNMGFHQIGKMRCDANLRYLYSGEQKPKGRRKQYDGKLVIGDTSRLNFVENQDGMDIYTAIVNCVNLKRDVRIVYLVEKVAQGFRYAVLFSTDTELDALSIYRYYQARFQIEFLFRDAKQFTGLCDCQARSAEALHSHFNASFAALNLIKWHDRQLSPERKPISSDSWKRRFFNMLFIERIFSNFALDLSLIKSSAVYEELCNFGVVAY